MWAVVSFTILHPSWVFSTVATRGVLVQASRMVLTNYLKVQEPREKVMYQNKALKELNLQNQIEVLRNLLNSHFSFFILQIKKALIAISLTMAVVAVISQNLTPTYSSLDCVGNGNTKQMLDLYIPAGVATPALLVIHIHGGAFMMGSKGVEEQPSHITSYNNGYTWADINNRPTTRPGRVAPWKRACLGPCAGRGRSFWPEQFPYDGCGSLVPGFRDQYPFSQFIRITPDGSTGANHSRIGSVP